MENQTKKRINMKLIEQETIESRQCEEEMDTNQLVLAIDTEEIYQKTMTQGNMTEDHDNPLYGTKAESGTGPPISCQAITKGQTIATNNAFCKGNGLGISQTILLCMLLEHYKLNQRA